MTAVKGSLGWLPCRSPRRSLASVRARASAGPRKVRRRQATGGAAASGANASPVVKLPHLALVTREQQPQDGKEETEGVAHGDSEMAPKAQRPQESGQPLWAPCLHSRVCCICSVRLLAPPNCLSLSVTLMSDAAWSGVPERNAPIPGSELCFQRPRLGRDFSLCTWLGAGRISFSGITRTEKGNPFPCKYQLHEECPWY